MSTKPQLAPTKEGAYYSVLAPDVQWTGDLEARPTSPDEDFSGNSGSLRPVPPPRPGTQDLIGFEVDAEAQDPPPDQQRTDTLDLSLQTPSRRGFERYDLGHNRVRVTIHSVAKVATHIGQLTQISVSGMCVATQQPLPFRTLVHVEWGAMPGSAMRFTGRVVRSTEVGMVIHLRTDDSNWRFRANFVDLLRTPDAGAPSITVWAASNQSEQKRYQKNQEQIARLTEAWAFVEADLDSDERHQEFIHECLRFHRLEYALERYRELKRVNPDSAQVARYLQQIGTILTFYTLKPADKNEGLMTPRRSKTLLLVMLVVVVGVVLFIGMHILSERRSLSRSHTPAAESGAVAPITPENDVEIPASAGPPR